MYFPKKITSKTKRYKYIKENADKFDNIIKDKIKRKHILKYRIETFHNIMNLLQNNDTKLYNLKYDRTGSLFDGDYGLYNVFDNLHCLLGIKRDDYSEYYIPKSWMASNRKSKLTSDKPANNIKVKNILNENYDSDK